MEKVLSAIGWVLSTVTAAGNGFVIFLVAKNRGLHSSANWFVLSLAGADFGVGVAVFPPAYFCFNSVACDFRVYIPFFWFFLHSSVTNLCVLTWDRYIAIVHPLKYNISLTNRSPGIVILVAWLVAFAIFWSLLVGMYTVTSDTSLKVLRLTGVTAFDIISCLLLFYAVVRILVVARAQSHQEAAIELQVQVNHSSNKDRNAPRPRKHNTALFIIALVSFFLGCYVVVNCLVLCIAFSCQLSHKAAEAGQIVILLLVLNSAVNPLVYAFLKRDIKKEMKKLISREGGRGTAI